MSAPAGSPDPDQGRPRDVYASRLRDSRSKLADDDRQLGLYANLRLVTFLGLLGVSSAALILKLLSLWWAVVPALLFVACVLRFDRAERAAQRSARLAQHYDDGLAKLDDRWMGNGRGGDQFRVADHLYADDLDILGPGSLFQRIAIVRTHPGAATLARWLLGPAALDEVRARQEAVRALRPRLDLREDFVVLSADVSETRAFEGLAEWGSQPRILNSRAARVAALLLSLVALPCLGLWLAGGSPLPFLGVVALEAALAWFYRKRARAALSQLEHRVHELEPLENLLRRLEQERFDCEKLKSLRSNLDTVGRSASRRIADLRRWLAALDSRRNMLLGPISPLLLWGTQIAFAVESWRATSGRLIAGWLDAIGEIEALISLSAFAFENPDAVFPELLDGPQPKFEAEGLAHPLLALGKAVRNDVRLGGPEWPRLLIVSGSNMSGKSTLLRAVGVAAVMALAGSVVRARQIRLSSLVLGSTLRIQDSLQAGRSRFFAEIVRLRQIFDLATANQPLLFLLDEILAGTNSHDRRIGAEAMLASLVGHGAIGLATTHDLALTELAARPTLSAVNVHFGDLWSDGKLTFDYRMLPGVVQHSNALALMRSIGLDV